MERLVDQGDREWLKRMGGDRVRFGVPMSGWTTFRVGGPAEAFYEPIQMDELRELVLGLGRRDIPYFVLGRGSNLLVLDQGIDGVVVVLAGSFKEIRHDQTEEGPVIHSGAGASLGALLSYCRRNGLSGLEFAAGIPGSVGGGLVMNAGAFGGEMGERVLGLTVLTPRGETMPLDRSQLVFSYRALSLEPGTVITHARFRVETASPDMVTDRVAANLKERKRAQPVDDPSAGCVFRNPPNDYAGRLIELAGLKGSRIGGAMVSPRHANYIVNVGGATGADILALMDLVQRDVRRKHGVHLDPEIRVIGR
jgi:UDP-N-acetylmuramate dehydrogenase